MSFDGTSSVRKSSKNLASVINAFVASGKDSSQVARSMSSEGASARRPSKDLSSVVDALRRSSKDRPQAMLSARAPLRRRSTRRPSLKYARLGSGTDLPEHPFSARRIYEICLVFRPTCSPFLGSGEWAATTSGSASNSARKADPGALERSRTLDEPIVEKLKQEGLLCFCYYTRDRTECIVKVGAEPDKLRNAAARLRYKLQLKPEYLSAYAEYRHDFPGRPELNFTDRRVVSHIYNAHVRGDEKADDGAIFSPIDRIMLVHHLITSEGSGFAGMNIAEMIQQSEVKAYFVLSDSEKLRDIKQNLLDWVMMSESHIVEVRIYFGDKVTIYFLWLSFYLKCLVPLAGIGFVLFVLELLAMQPDDVTARPFCIFVSIWLIQLPHFWKREEAKYAIRWGNLHHSEQFESIGAENRRSKESVEAYYPWTWRRRRLVTSSCVVTVMGALAVIAALALLWFRRTMKTDFVGGIVVFQFVVAIEVEAMNSVLCAVASALTKWEDHRTHWEHDVHLLAKLIVLQFLSSFSALYYIAFFNHHSYFFGSAIECLADDCLVDLQFQLGILCVVRTMVRNVFGVGMPLLRMMRARHSGVPVVDMSAAESDLRKDEFSVFWSFNKMLVTHGYGMLFTIVSPWVCAATLLAVVLQLFMDVKAVTEWRRRSLPSRCRSIEPWSTAFEVYSVMAALTNVSLLIFVSGQYDHYSLTQKLTFFSFIETVIFLSRIVTKILFPEVPINIERLQRAQADAVHRCLQNLPQQPDLDFPRYRDAVNSLQQLEVFDRDFLENESDEPLLSLRKSGRGWYQSVVEKMFSTNSTS